MISNIQRFCVHDGPGIRTTVFFKGCPLRCGWCSNPETQRPKGELMLNPARCQTCGSCVRACPQGALRMRGGEICLEQESCDLCGNCVQACPDRLIKIHGMEMGAEEIMATVLRDRCFYEASGEGGITLSGGEPLMQPELAKEVLGLAKKSGITTCIETCLHYPFERLEAVLDDLDYIYYDFKHADAKKHLRFTGVDNALIRKNICELNRRRPDARTRIPVIPGFNDTGQDISEICRALKDMGILQVELMRYHNWAASKYHALLRRYDYEAVERFREEEFLAIRERYRENGIELL